MLYLIELQFVSHRSVGVHERRGPLGASAAARRLAARRGAAFVRPFSFVTFLLGKQKKSKMIKILTDAAAADDRKRIGWPN